MKTCLGVLLVGIAIFLPAAFGTPSPPPGANQAFLFASPNTRESPTDRDAETRLTSFEEINATAVADRAACALTRDVQIADTLGIYDTSSENSFILEADLDRRQSEYLAALLGLYSRQEFVLLFLAEPTGGDRLWIVKTAQSPHSAISTLRKLKLPPVTVRTENGQTEIWFVDLGGKRAAELKTLAADVNGQASLTPGIAELLGNRRRAAAVTAWRRQIKTFEQQSGRHLSVQLASNGWRTATTVHTCSAELSLP